MGSSVNLTREQWRGHLAMLAFSALVAGSFSLGHIVANEIAPQAITTIRFLLASVVIGVLALGGPGFRRSDFVAPWRYLALGGLFALYFVLMFEGLKFAPPVSAAAVFTLMPIISAFAGYFILRQITTKRMALALTIAGLGALWVIFRADLGAMLAFDLGKGEAIYFFGCVAHAVYTPLIRRLNRGESPVIFTFGTLIGGSLLLLVFGFRDIMATDWAALPAIVWITLAYLVIFATALSFLAVQYATMRLPAAKVMAYSYLTPTWVICWEYFLGNGLPVPLILLGVIATVVALVILLKDEEGA